MQCCLPLRDISSNVRTSSVCAIESIFLVLYARGSWLIVARWCLMETDICASIGSGNGLLSDDRKPLPEPMLTYHHIYSVAQYQCLAGPKSMSHSVKRIIIPLTEISEYVFQNDWISLTVRHSWSQNHYCSTMRKHLCDHTILNNVNMSSAARKHSRAYEWFVIRILVRPSAIGAYVFQLF